MRRGPTLSSKKRLLSPGARTRLINRVLLFICTTQRPLSGEVTELPYAIRQKLNDGNVGQRVRGAEQRSPGGERPPPPGVRTRLIYLLIPVYLVIYDSG